MTDCATLVPRPSDGSTARLSLGTTVRVALAIWESPCVTWDDAGVTWDGAVA